MFPKTVDVATLILEFLFYFYFLEITKPYFLKEYNEEFSPYSQLNQCQVWCILILRLWKCSWIIFRCYGDVYFACCSNLVFSNPHTSNLQIAWRPDLCLSQATANILSWANSQKNSVWKLGWRIPLAFAHLAVCDWSYPPALGREAVSPNPRALMFAQTKDYLVFKDSPPGVDSHLNLPHAKDEGLCS